MSSLSLSSRARTNFPHLVSAWLDSSLVSWKDNLSPFSVLSETRFTPGLLSPAGLRAPWRSWGGGEACLSFTQGESEASRRVVPVAAQMDEAPFVWLGTLTPHLCCVHRHTCYSFSNASSYHWPSSACSEPPFSATPLPTRHLTSVSCSWEQSTPPCARLT